MPLSVFVRAVAVAAIAVTPLIAAPVSGAEPLPPAAVGIGGDVVATANASVGAVVVNDTVVTGWVASDGVVVTSAIAADEVGTAVEFRRAGSSEASDCYVARVVTSLQLALLRCEGLGGTALEVASGYPSPGTPVFVTVAAYTPDESTGVTLVSEGGLVSVNDFEFMGTARPQFSMQVSGGDTASDGVLRREDHAAAPILGADGRVVSTVLVAPERGGSPIGTVPSELAKQIKDADDLPETFNAAAVLTTARRAAIPVAAGFVIGLLWAALRRNGSLLAKTLGMAAVGLAGAIAYTVFTVLVVGPQTLVG